MAPAYTGAIGALWRFMGVINGSFGCYFGAILIALAVDGLLGG